MTVRLPSYLHRNRHGIFGFRFIVPRSLQIYFEAKQYRFSLRTADKKRAKRLALMLASLASNYLSRIQQMTEHRAKAATARDLIAAFNELLDEQVAPSTDLVETITSLGTSELEAFVKAVCAEMPENDIRLSIAEHIVTLKKRADAYKTEHQSIAAMVVSEANAKMKVFEDDEAWDALQSRMASSIAEH